MKLIPQAFYDAGMQRHHPIAMEPESQAPLSALAWDTVNWGEGWQYTMPPKIDTKKISDIGETSDEHMRSLAAEQGDDGWDGLALRNRHGVMGERLGPHLGPPLSLART